MSIISEFFIKFGSNAKDVTKDVTEAQKATDNFETQLKKSDKATADLGLSFSKLALAGVTALESVAALGKLKDAIIGAVNYNAEIEKTSRLTNINARELSLWNDVVARSGGNPGGKEYLDFISKLNAKYAELGVNERTQLMNGDLFKIADRLKELEDQFGQGGGEPLATKLGTGPDLYLTLRQGSAAVQDMLDKMGRLDTTTKDSAAQAFAFNQQLVDLGITFRSVFGDALPLISDLVNILSKGARIMIGLADSVWNFRVSPVLKKLFEEDFGTQPRPVRPARRATINRSCGPSGNHKDIPTPRSRRCWPMRTPRAVLRRMRSGITARRRGYSSGTPRGASVSSPPRA